MAFNGEVDIMENFMRQPWPILLGEQILNIVEVGKTQSDILV
jgi:hypothetical protein